MSLFSYSGYGLQWFQQRVAVDLEKFHDVLLYLVVLISPPEIVHKPREVRSVTGLSESARLYIGA